MQTNPRQEADAYANTHLAGDEVGYDSGVPTVEDLKLKSHEQNLADELKGAWHGLILPLEEEVAVGAPQCQRCEVLPRPMIEAGSLELRFPHTFTLGKTLNYLIERNWQHVHNEGLVKIAVPAGLLAALVSALERIDVGARAARRARDFPFRRRFDSDARLL